MACIVEGNSNPWSSNTIAFEINTDKFPLNSTEYNEINNAISEINDKTIINLIERTNQPNYIFFTEGERYKTRVGYRFVSGGYTYKHNIYCNEPTKKSTIHEICHALGLWHKQARQDRDDYISVRFGRIRRDRKHDFYRHLKNGIDFGIYDYDSIMHYRRRSGTETSWVINKQIVNQKSKVSPSLAGYNGKLHMVHLGNTSNNIWHSWFDGTNWTPNVKISNQKSKASPSLAVYNGKLHMVHLGNSSNNIWHSWFDDTNWTPNMKIADQKSKASPSILAYDGNLHMVHLVSSSNNIWYSWYDNQFESI